MPQMMDFELISKINFTQEGDKKTQTENRELKDTEKVTI